MFLKSGWCHGTASFHRRTKRTLIWEMWGMGRLRAEGLGWGNDSVGNTFAIRMFEGLSSAPRIHINARCCNVHLECLCTYNERNQREAPSALVYTGANSKKTQPARSRKGRGCICPHRGHGMSIPALQCESTSPHQNRIEG